MALLPLEEVIRIASGGQDVTASMVIIMANGLVDVCK